MKRFFFKLLPIAGILIAWGSAHAAVTCTITATSLTGIVFDPNSALQRQGTVSGTCTLTQGDANNINSFYVGISQGGRSPRSMLLALPNEVTYQINKSSGAGVWNEAPGTTVPTANGGVIFTRTGNRAVAIPYSYTFFLDIPAQPTDPVGTYTDTLTARIGVGTTNPVTALATATFNLSATIAPFCRFNTNPSQLNLNYTSFRTTAATGTSGFSLNCTAGTSYSQAVAPATGTALGLSYSLALSATTGLIGNAAVQNYTITGTAAAGQSGTCATSGVLCSANNPHTITVTY